VLPAATATVLGLGALLLRRLSWPQALAHP